MKHRFYFPRKVLKDQSIFREMWSWTPPPPPTPLTSSIYYLKRALSQIFLRRITTVESRFLEPPGETQIGSWNREFEKSKVASNYA